MKEFRAVYEKRGAHDLQSQVKYLAGLAEFYHKQGAEKSDWVSLLKVNWLLLQLHFVWDLA